MDFVSHGLWGGAIVGRKNLKTFAYAVVFSVLPDIVGEDVMFGIILAGVNNMPSLEGGRPNITDAITNGEIHLVINTPSGKLSVEDDSYIRKSAIKYKVPYITTTAAALAAAKGIAADRQGHSEVKSLQEYHRDIG